MKNLSATKKLLAVAVAGALSLASAGASAAQTFTYDLDGISGGTTVTANGISGVSSEYLQAISANTFAGSGWLEMTSLNLGSTSIAGTSYADTGLYATYSLIATLISGTFGAAGSTYAVSGLNISLWYDVGLNNTFTQANALTNTLATVSNTAGDKLLATGIGGGESYLFNMGAAGLTALSSMTLTSDGSSFFISPTPFYQYAFESFIGSSSAWVMNSTGGLSVANAIGGVDFVPEPGSLALIGLGLAGLGLSRRRKQ